MLKNYTMTGAQMKIEGLYPGIDDTADADFSYDSVNDQSTFGAKQPEITLWAGENNSAEIYIQEHASVGSDEKIWLQPGGFITLTYSDVEAMNIFYVTGTASDVLFVIVR